MTDYRRIRPLIFYSIFVGGLLALMLCHYMAFRELKNRLVAVQWVEHTNYAREKINRVILDLSNLNRQDTNPVPPALLITLLQHDFNELKSFVSDNQNQQKHIQSIEHLVMALGQTELTPNTLRTINNVLAIMDNEESILLKQRTLRFHKVIEISQKFIFLSAALGYGLLIFSIVLIFRFIRRDKEIYLQEVAIHKKMDFILTSSHFGTWELNIETGEIKCSSLYLQIFGYTDETAPKWSYTEFKKHVFPEDLPLIEQRLKSAMHENTVYVAHYRIIRADNQRVRWLWSSGKRDNHSIVGILHDITEEKEKEEALQMKEQQMRLLIDGAPDYAIIMLDLNGIINTWNTGAERISGYRREEIVGKKITCFYLSQDLRNHHLERSLKITREEGRYEEQGWRLRKNKTKFWANITINPLYNNKNELIGYCKVIRDMTEMKKTEALRRSNETLEQFAYIAAHDLKAPLRAIETLASWIDEDAANQLSEESKDNFNLLRQRARRMSNLINGILQYSRASTPQEGYSVISLKELMKEILDSINPPEKFTFHISDKLPTLHARKVQLTQVFTNLVNNSIQHHDKAQGHITVDVKNSEGDAFYEFSVTDDGPGIEPQYHSKIFEVFQSLEPNDNTNSTGIGLSIVKKIVESQGGEITVDSSLGRGCTFRFTWPKSPPNIHRKVYDKKLSSTQV